MRLITSEELIVKKNNKYRMLIPPLWSLSLQAASFRGLKFQVTESGITRGRRVAIHEYFGRDVPYVEDLGRSRQEINFQGFLTGDNVYKQRDDFAIACDLPGLGTLVHPSLGKQQANLISASFGETSDAGRMVAIELHFIIAGAILFPSLNPKKGQNSLLAKLQAGLNAIGAAISDFEDTVAGYAATVEEALAPFAGLLVIAGFALAALSAVRGISLGQPDVSLGRYGDGNLATPTNAPSATPLSTAATIALATSTALATACTARQTVALAIAAASNLAAAGDPAFPQSLANLVEAARTAIVDPADQITALIPLASYTSPAPIPSASPIGMAIAATMISTSSLCVRLALASLANACAAYQPTSSTDTQRLIDQISPIFDNAITFAADNGDLNSYLDLRSLKSSTIADLQARGSQLPALVTITSKQSLPSLVWASRLYAGDASRSDELIQRTNVPNPCFLPLSFVALSY
jgi:prophage DNA circulation protein